MKKRKDNKRMQTIMMGFIAFIMVTSIVGFLWKGGQPKVEYNGIPFVQEASGWTAEINTQKISFNYHPNEVEHINISPAITQRLDTVEIDTTYDINDSYAEYIAKVQYTLGLGLNNFDIFVVKGFTEENEFNRPVITCDDATAYVPVIYFKKSNETKVYLEGNCIMAEAYRGDDLIKIKDRLLYTILGIMK
ncbi:hypothetical protein KY360_03160 [Candidatus Woesearchaeota archaeon]|nr:hypothetical protein [Candidatus Woesearchaeota archaeon]